MPRKGYCDMQHLFSLLLAFQHLKCQKSLIGKVNIQFVNTNGYTYNFWKETWTSNRSFGLLPWLQMGRQAIQTFFSLLVFSKQVEDLHILCLLHILLLNLYKLHSREVLLVITVWCNILYMSYSWDQDPPMPFLI